MAAVDAVAGDGLGVLMPDGEHVVATALRAALAPQDEKRHREVAAAIGAVVGEADRGSGAILVAGRPDRLGVAEASQIFGEGLRLQHGRVAEQVAQKEFGLRADQPFRKSSRLDQKEPMPSRGRRLLGGRHDVEQCHTLDALRMVARQSVGDPRPAVVPGDSEALEAERRIVSTWSRANARFEYSVLSGPAGGLELSPQPRRSDATTVNSVARRGASLPTSDGTAGSRAATAEAARCRRSPGLCRHRCLDPPGLKARKEVGHWSFPAPPVARPLVIMSALRFAMSRFLSDLIASLTRARYGAEPRRVLPSPRRRAQISHRRRAATAAGATVRTV